MCFLAHFFVLSIANVQNAHFYVCFGGCAFGTFNFFNTGCGFMLKLSSSITLITLGLTACVSQPYSTPEHLKFQEQVKGSNVVLNVQRDAKLCDGETADQQNCPINFYIDNIQAGRFYINNNAKFQLKPESYNFKVKNCNENSCQSCDVDLEPKALQNLNFNLSVDEMGQPLIKHNDQYLVCNKDEKKETLTQPVAVPELKKVNINLAADTLFKFNGSSEADLLPKGRQEILNVAKQISSQFVSVHQINLVGHTDRLGTAQYNQVLGQNRANTVRSILVQNGVDEAVIRTQSAGKNQPVTDGCFAVQAREALQACLQPDRRVSVEILGITQ